MNTNGTQYNTHHPQMSHQVVYVIELKKQLGVLTWIFVMASYQCACATQPQA